MLNTYLLFARIDVLHGYFNNQQARNISINPHPDTLQFLNHFDYTIKPHACGIGLFIRAEQLDLLWQTCQKPNALSELTFEIHCSDIYWACYTDYIQPPLPGRFRPSAENKLHLSEYSSLDRPHPGSMLAEVCLPLQVAASGQEWGAAWGWQYQFVLQPRKVVWKYLLLGDWQGHQLMLQDSHREIKFTPPVLEDLPNGRQAWVSRSEQAIAMQEKSIQRFELRDTASQPERILLERLPLATPHNLFKESWQGEQITVSEIFVNR